MLKSKTPVEPKCSITFRDETPTQASWGYLNEFFYVTGFKSNI